MAKLTRPYLYVVPLSATRCLILNVNRQCKSKKTKTDFRVKYKNFRQTVFRSSTSKSLIRKVKNKRKTEIRRISETTMELPRKKNEKKDRNDQQVF